MELISHDGTKGDLQSPQNMELHKNFTSILAKQKDAAWNQLNVKEWRFEQFLQPACTHILSVRSKHATFLVSLSPDITAEYVHAAWFAASRPILVMMASLMDRQNNYIY